MRYPYGHVRCVVVAAATALLSCSAFATPPHQADFLVNTIWLYGFVILLAIGYLIWRFGKAARHYATQSHYLETLMAQSQDGICICDQKLRIFTSNPAMERLIGSELEQLRAKSLTIFSAQGKKLSMLPMIEQNLLQQGHWRGEVWLANMLGDEMPIQLSITKIANEQKHREPQYLAICQDVSERKNTEKALRQLATRDPITHLPNRTLFLEMLDKAINDQDNNMQHTVLLIMDLDKFRKINESLSHFAGDELLSMVAKRLTSQLDKGMVLARLGGDEFAVLIPPYNVEGQVQFVAKRCALKMLSCFKTPFSLQNCNAMLSVSIGIAFTPNHADCAINLLRSADNALAQVKRHGRNDYAFFDNQDDHVTEELLQLESEMWQAIEHEQFFLHYQAKMTLSNRHICGVEALVRWNNPTRGLIPPEQFIHLSEDNGMIVPLSRLIFRQASEQAKRWLMQGVFVGRVAINISPLHFQRTDMADDCLAMLTEVGLEPRFIELEITESAVMSNPEFALSQMKRLKQHGFTIALDDFGTGHSSLGYLKHYPIDRLKIDKTFIEDMENSETDRNITSTIIQLAKYLGIEVVAEGVETETQAYMLHVMGCQQIQGYFVSRPIPAVDIPEIIRKHQAAM